MNDALLVGDLYTVFKECLKICWASIKTFTGEDNSIQNHSWSDDKGKFTQEARKKCSDIWGWFTLLQEKNQELQIWPNY